MCHGDTTAADSTRMLFHIHLNRGGAWRTRERSCCGKCLPSPTPPGIAFGNYSLYNGLHSSTYPGVLSCYKVCMRKLHGSRARTEGIIVSRKDMIFPSTKDRNQVNCSKFVEWIWLYEHWTDGGTNKRCCQLYYALFCFNCVAAPWWNCIWGISPFCRFCVLFPLDKAFNWRVRRQIAWT